MSETLDRPTPKTKRDRKRSDRIVVDGNYVREQANEAARLFFAPVSGIVRALTDSAPKVKRRKRAA